MKRWYHAAWLHCGDSGREPIRGLTNELSTPPYSLAKGQSVYLATWANVFFNAPGPDKYVSSSYYKRN
jgi:hypothetical protein